MVAVVTSRALADQLDRTSASCDTVAGLAAAVFRTVAAAVPFAFGCLATTDPSSGLITGAVKSAELPLGDEEFAAAEYGGPDVNLFAEIARRPVPVGVLSVDTDGHPEHCARLRDYMTPQFGFTDEIRLACRSRNAVWGALAVYRHRGEAHFTPRDGEVVAGLAEPIAAGLQRVLFSAAPAPGSPPGPAVLVVDAADRLTDVTATAEDRIAELGGWDHGALPASVLAVVSTARASRRPARTTVPAARGRWITLQALPLDGGSGRSVVVTIDAAAAESVGQLTLAARGLTGREQDVTQLVLHGASTKDIAAALHLSPHTVQDHLKSIFVKLGVSSRREMIARLMTSETTVGQ